MSFSHIFAAALLALASNLDNVGVGIAYGMRKVRVPLMSNFFIAAITAAGTLGSMLCGNTIGKLLSHGVAALLAGGALIAMGAWVVIKEGLTLYRSGNQALVAAAASPGETGYLGKVHTIRINPLSADSDRSGQIDFTEAALLGLALIPNNLLNGAAAGMMGLSVTAIVILVFLLSAVTIWIGIEIGQQCGKRWIGGMAGVAAGVLLMFVGACQVVI